MDGYNKCLEINSLYLTHGSLQVLPWNSDTVIEKIDCWKGCRHITDFFQYIHAWNQGGIIISIYDISFTTIPVLQKNSKFERMTGCDYSLTIQKGQLIEWMAATGITN